MRVDEGMRPSGKAVLVVEVKPVSRSVSHVEAKAADAPSPPPVFAFGAGSNVEQVDS